MQFVLPRSLNYKNIFYKTINEINKNKKMKKWKKRQKAMQKIITK